MATKTLIKSCDDNTLEFKCEGIDGEYLDTRVTFNYSFLCWCTFSEAEQFAEEFFAVISKYRI